MLFCPFPWTCALISRCWTCISFCTSVMLRIFVSLNYTYMQLRHLRVTSVAPVRSLLLAPGNLPSPCSGCQMAAAGFLRSVSMCPPNFTAWHRGWPNRTPPYRVPMGHCIITPVHGITEVTWVRIHNAMFLLSSQAHLEEPWNCLLPLNGTPSGGSVLPVTQLCCRSCL